MFLSEVGLPRSRRWDRVLGERCLLTVNTFEKKKEAGFGRGRNQTEVKADQALSNLAEISGESTLNGITPCWG